MRERIALKRMDLMKWIRRSDLLQFLRRFRVIKESRSLLEGSLTSVKCTQRLVPIRSSTSLSPTECFIECWFSTTASNITRASKFATKLRIYDSKLVEPPQHQSCPRSYPLLGGTASRCNHPGEVENPSALRGTWTRTGHVSPFLFTGTKREIIDPLFQSGGRSVEGRGFYERS